MLDAKKFIQLFGRKQERYRNLFSTPEGEYVLNDLMRHIQINRIKKDSNENMQFDNGRKSVGFYILNILNRNVDNMIEQMERQNTEEGMLDV